MAHRLRNVMSLYQAITKRPGLTRRDYAKLTGFSPRYIGKMIDQHYPSLREQIAVSPNPVCQPEYYKKLTPKQKSKIKLKVSERPTCHRPVRSVSRDQLIQEAYAAREAMKVALTERWDMSHHKRSKLVAAMSSLDAKIDKVVEERRLTNARSSYTPKAPRPQVTVVGVAVL